MKNKGLEQYLLSAKNHSIKYLNELNELRDDLLADNFKSRDFRAAERVLQIYTELCIGLAKHYVKTLCSYSATDAYQAFLQLKEQNEISTDELTKWRKIIGMRNALVHDYLNLDPAILEGVIRDKHYSELEVFCTQAMDFLKANG